MVYDVDGLRDSVRHGITGLVCEENTSVDLAKNIIDILSDKEKYDTLRKDAWQWSKKINFGRSYREFLETIGNYNLKQRG